MTIYSSLLKQGSIIETGCMWNTEVLHKYRNYQDWDILRIETRLTRKMEGKKPDDYVIPTPDFSVMSINGVEIFRWDYT